MCSRLITSFWVVRNGLSSLARSKQLPGLWWSSRGAHSEVDAINQELADFFGVEYTSDIHSDVLSSSSLAAGSAQHTGLGALPRHISSGTAPLPETDTEHSELAQHASSQGSRLTHSHVSAHTMQQSQQQQPQTVGPAAHRQPWDTICPGNIGNSASSPTADADASDGQRLTHVDSSGKASMVDVSHKHSSSRTAAASCIVHLGPAAYQLVKSNQIKKGDVLTLAQIAGIQGAKQTAYLIPLCHNIFLSKVEVTLLLDDEQSAVLISATAKTTGQTGVEMEALTAAGVAALTVYDMCKAVSKDIVISDLRLDFKTGGNSGTWARGHDIGSIGSSRM